MLDQTAKLLEIEGANPFRACAPIAAPRVVETLPQAVANLLAAGRDLSELPGSAKTSPARLPESWTPGHFDVLDTLKRELPGELGAIAALPGLGPKRVKLLYDKLGVRTLEDLDWMRFGIDQARRG